MTKKETIAGMIANRVLGPKTASILGKLAHEITDMVDLGDGRVGVCTPRHGWHFATAAEIERARDIVWD